MSGRNERLVSVKPCKSTTGSPAGAPHSRNASVMPVASSTRLFTPPSSTADGLASPSGPLSALRHAATSKRTRLARRRVTALMLSPSIQSGTAILLDVGREPQQPTGSAGVRPDWAGERETGLTPTASNRRPNAPVLEPWGECSMKAIQFSRFGGPEVLEPVDLAMPAPKSGEVLVRVRASGVNLADTLMRQDRYAMTPPLPAVPGSEVAGIVVALGEGAEGIAVGVRVAASLFAAGMHLGGYAEYVAVDARYVTPIPAELSFEDATALMVQGLSALALTRHTPVAGKSVLVSAAGGGVGSMLVQLLKRAGARQVIAAASTEEKRRHALGLGADAAVDYTAERWSDRVREVTDGA